MYQCDKISSCFENPAQQIIPKHKLSLKFTNANQGSWAWASTFIWMTLKTKGLHMTIAANVLKLEVVDLFVRYWFYMSRLMGKQTICIGENKGAYQLRSNCEADQRLCFRYSDSTIPLLLKSEISSFLLFSVLVQPGLCRTCSETTLLVFPRGGSYLET